MRNYCLAVGLVLFACGPNQLDSSTFEDLAVCGNGELEAGEACDDGNDAPLDACTVGCQIAVCGDGIARQDLSPDEEVPLFRSSVARSGFVGVYPSGKQFMAIFQKRYLTTLKKYGQNMLLIK